MTDKSMRSADIVDLVNEYADAAAIHGRTVLTGDYKAANIHAKRIAAIYRELRDRGPASQNALLSLLSHNDVNVRKWSAAHALEFSPADGERVLEALARDEGMAGLGAKTTLSEWRNGSLVFP